MKVLSTLLIFLASISAHASQISCRATIVNRLTALSEDRGFSRIRDIAYANSTTLGNLTQMVDVRTVHQDGSIQDWLVIYKAEGINSCRVLSARPAKH